MTEKQEKKSIQPALPEKIQARQTEVFMFEEYNRELGKGGVYQLINQYTALLQHDIHLHFIKFHANQPAHYYRLETIKEGTVHHFGRLVWKLGFLSVLPPAFLTWIHTLPDNKRTVFHLHSVFRTRNYVLAKILQEKNIPYIFTPHDSYTLESLKKKRVLKLIFIQLFEKYVMNHARLVHAITPEGAASIARFTSSKIALVTNFVPDYHTGLHDTFTERYICFVGRLDIFQKGIDEQIRAYKCFRQHVAEPVSFFLVGSHSLPERARLQALLLEEGLAQDPQVVVTGRVSEEKKCALLKRAYVYLQLSRFEGFGLSVVEALSFGTPVIVSDKVPVGTQIRAANAGYVVKNFKEAAQALQQIYACSPAQYRRLANNARQCYEQYFHPQIIKPQLLNMYEKAISND